MAESLWSTTGSSLEETAPTDRRIPRRTSEVSIRLACRALGEPAIAAPVVLVAISPVRAAVPQDEQQKLIAFDAASGDFFGQSVVIDGDTAVVGARRDDDAGSSSGSAYVYTRSGTTWTQQQKLVASDASTSAGFGGSVAIDGDTIVIGANGDQGSGSAYVFTRSGTTWTQQQKLTAIEAAATDLFSWSVDVDGDTIAVGNPLDDDGGSGSGSVELFTRAGTVWTRQQELTASDPAADDEFGVSVAVDGDTAIVGASLDELTWEIVAYALLSLTVVRMLPVALVLIGTGFHPKTMIFMGWFGPRGLATFVFALKLLDRPEIAHGEEIFTIAVWTVLFSVVLHGITARPGVKWYGAHAEGIADQPEKPELADVETLPLRYERHPQE